MIRECVTINRGTTKEAGVTTIGDDNLFMAYSHVAHDCHVGNQCVFANNATLGGHVHLGDWVIMGGLSGVHQFCKVGAHAFIANNAAVTRDVPPYVMAVGQPAAAHSINSEGLKRRGFTPEQIRNLRNAFRLLYRSGLKLDDADGAARGDRAGAAGGAADRGVPAAVHPQHRPLSGAAPSVAAAHAPPAFGLVAGEASGDNLGGPLIQALAAREPGAGFYGVAGPRMMAAGCEAWYPADALAVMGLTEIVRHLPRLLRLRRQLLGRLVAAQPAAFIGIDSPEFNLRMARALRQRGIPTVQYVSPQVWAWRQGRVRSIAAVGGPGAVRAAVRDRVLRSRTRCGRCSSGIRSPTACRSSSDPSAARAALGLPATGPLRRGPAGQPPRRGEQARSAVCGHPRLARGAAPGDRLRCADGERRGAYGIRASAARPRARRAGDARRRARAGCAWRRAMRCSWRRVRRRWRRHS